MAKRLFADAYVTQMGAKGLRVNFASKAWIISTEERSRLINTMNRMNRKKWWYSAVWGEAQRQLESIRGPQLHHCATFLKTLLKVGLPEFHYEYHLEFANGILRITNAEFERKGLPVRGGVQPLRSVPLQRWKRSYSIIPSLDDQLQRPDFEIPPSLGISLQDDMLVAEDGEHKTAESRPVDDDDGLAAALAMSREAHSPPSQPSPPPSGPTHADGFLGDVEDTLFAEEAVEIAHPRRRSPRSIALPTSQLDPKVDSVDRARPPAPPTSSFVDNDRQDGSRTTIRPRGGNVVLDDRVSAVETLPERQAVPASRSWELLMRGNSDGQVGWIDAKMIPDGAPPTEADRLSTGTRDWLATSSDDDQPFSKVT